MEYMLGFNEPLPDDVVEEKSHSFKLVPWICWDEWKFVKQSLFCSSPESVASALRRISTWRSRGCVPVAIDVTASIVEIQQKDTFFRNDLNERVSPSEEMLAMLYCMAIMRLVNGVVEKTRKKNEISIGEAADAIGLPRMLIDIRHEGSHRDLPSLQLVRLASSKALDWLISYYWEPQEKAIPSQNDQTANIRKKIKRKLLEAAICLKARQTEKSSPSHVKEKRVRQTERVCGLNKFLVHVAGKSSLSNSGSKKQVMKSLKKVLRLYSSFSLEVAYVMLEYLLNALDSLVDHVEDSQTENNRTEYDEWRSIVLKLSRKEPEFLLMLTQAVLEKMETQNAINLEIGDNQSPENRANSRQIELLSVLFEWLVQNLKTLNHVPQKESAEIKDSETDKHIPKATILGLIQRCLFVSSPVNKRLMASAIDLAYLTGDISLLHKLKKLSLLWLSDSDTKSEESCNETLLSQQEDYIRRAEEKFEFIIKQRHKQSKNEKPEKSSKWAIAKSWNTCPIGMLPHTIGFSGRVPILDCKNEVKTSEIEEKCEVNQCGKREAENSIEEIDNTFVKKAKETKEEDIFDKGIKGSLVIDGVWMKDGLQEFLAVESCLQLLA